MRAGEQPPCEGPGGQRPPGPGPPTSSHAGRVAVGRAGRRCVCGNRRPLLECHHHGGHCHCLEEPSLLGSDLLQVPPQVRGNDPQTRFLAHSAAAVGLQSSLSVLLAPGLERDPGAPRARVTGGKAALRGGR